MNSKKSIPEALDRLGIKYQGRAFSCPNPIHPSGDKSPSAGFFGPGDSRYKCHSCGQSGDSIDLTMLAKGCSYPEAKAFLGGTGMSPTTTRPTAARASKPGGKKIHTITHKGKAFTFTATPDTPRWPTMRDGTEAEIAALSKSRGISPGCLRFAMRWGILRFADVAEGVCWLLTDATGRAAEARRLDGELWKRTGKKPWAFPGSRKDWPLGLRTDSPADSCSIVLLTEGTPDCLAALELLVLAGRADILPVAMLGSEATIGTDAIEAINGRPVLIWADDDDPGREAAARWVEELRSAGSPVRAFLPPVAKDVNDWLRCHPTREEVRAALPSFTTEGGGQ